MFAYNVIYSTCPYIQLVCTGMKRKTLINVKVKVNLYRSSCIIALLNKACNINLTFSDPEPKIYNTDPVTQ